MVLLAFHLQPLINPGALSGVLESGPRQLSRTGLVIQEGENGCVKPVLGLARAPSFSLLEALALSSEGRFPAPQGGGSQGSIDYEFVHDKGMHIAWAQDFGWESSKLVLGSRIPPAVPLTLSEVLF